jgi:hypothetical protein
MKEWRGIVVKKWRGMHRMPLHFLKILLRCYFFPFLAAGFFFAAAFLGAAFFLAVAMVLPP